MYVENVVSYLGAWEKLSATFPTELGEILCATDAYYGGRVNLESGTDTYSRNYWEKSLFDLGWQLNDQVHYSPTGRRINLGSLGPTKNGVSAQVSLANPSWFHRWLFSQGTLAVRYAMVKIPVLIAPMRRYEPQAKYARVSSSTFASFEYFKDQLETIAPLSVQFPFVLLGVSESAQLLLPAVTEIASDPNITTEKIVVDRCIEFSPEFHQAGLGILSYFGEFLRENYPDKDAKVRIEQHGLKVRLTVETEDGNTEVVEKALRDYQLVMTGKAKPEQITTSDKALLDLRNELRITQFRLESQRDIIGVQNRQIDTLMNILGTGFEAANSRPIAIQISPTFHNSNTATINSHISAAIEQAEELSECLSPDAELRVVLADLLGSLSAVETERNVEKLRASPALGKLERFLRRFQEGTASVSGSLQNLEKGKDAIFALAKSYNAIAALCGLPQVPGM